MRGLAPLFLLSLICVQCLVKKSSTGIVVVQNDFQLTLPSGFDTIPVPSDNQFSKARVALGKRLFFDQAMSRDSSVSCASCHLPSKFFTDGLPKSRGIGNQEVDRNAPSLLNVGYMTSFLREGGVPTLEQQIIVPSQEHREFDLELIDLEKRLQQDSSYVEMAYKAYGRTIDPWVIMRSIACFERTLISGNSRFDRYKNGDKSALTDLELKGMELFYGDKLKCSECHSGLFFTNESFANNGLYEIYKDHGRGRLTYKKEDTALFKVPGLRNVAATAPYMHDGSINDLKSVIKHYSSGGKNHPNKSNLITGFEISEDELNAVVDFLQSLTDSSVLEINY